MNGRLGLRWAGVLVGVAFGSACAAQTPEPTLAKPAPPAPSTTRAAEPAEVEQPAAAPPSASEPITPTSFVVGRLEVYKLAPTLFAGAPPAPAVEPVPYERFRLLGTLQVGHSHLSMLDLSVDETRLLAVSESEARLRVYDTASQRLLAQASVEGYGKFGAGEFLFWPLPDQPHRVMFAAPFGIQLLDPTGSGGALWLGLESAGDLKVDHGLVGNTTAEGQGQASVLTLYQPGYREGVPELAPLLRVVASERVEDWVLSPDHSQLGVVYFPSNEIEWIDLRARQVLWRTSAPEFTNSLDLSPDGSLLAVGGKELRVVQLANPQEVGVYTGFDNNIHEVHFTPASDAVAASSYDGHLRFVSATAPSGTLTLRKTLRHTGTANVYAFRFTRDGRRVYSCSGDRSVRVFGL